MTQGYVALPQTQQPQTQQPKLSDHQLAEEIAESIFQIQNNLSDNFRLAQFLIDLAISEVKPPH